MQLQHAAWRQWLLATIFLGFGLPGIGFADNSAGYWQNSSGKIWRNSSGECWRTGRWSKQLAIAECESGITDADADGVADAKDDCPNTPKGVKVNSKGCPLDSDGDGVADHKDQCPSTAAGIAVDENGCPRDSDRDGVTDDKDQCPGTRSGAKVDSRGCEIPTRVELKGVNFPTDSAVLTASSAAVLNDVADELKRNPDIKVEIAGHTDNRGSVTYNKHISQQRAEAVRDYLVSQGANPDNLSARGYGPDKPVAKNDTAEGRAKNRRVELIIQ